MRKIQFISKIKDKRNIFHYQYSIDRIIRNSAFFNTIFLR
ncbi:hypothetical protein Y888_19490 [Mixta calida B021323]|nr:hypothetical protein Y888_19490 [Mixta calida B021323]